LKIDNSFIPPQDYKPIKKIKKIYIPGKFLADKRIIASQLIGKKGKMQKQL